MSLPGSTTVLIVGAGPCGMAAALSLYHQGIKDVVIVDAVEAGENSSRAMVIHAATLEALNTIGCFDFILPHAEKITRVDMHQGTSVLLTADFSQLADKTQFPFGLLIPQSQTERAMLAKLTQLGIHVFRPLKVVSAKESDDDDSMVDVRFESGEVVKARYVIGADGAHSVIRGEAGIGFTDPQGDGPRDFGDVSQIVLGDVTFSSPLPQDTPRFMLSVANSNFMLVSQFPAHAYPDATGSVYRIACGVPQSMGVVPHAPGMDYLQKAMTRMAPEPLRAARIDAVHWSSRYKTRSAIADRPFARLPVGGVVVLVGDAAHIHSPIGGQGMSLGIRDAISLGPILRAHLDAPEDDRQLLEWARWRHERALEVISLTEHGMRLITSQRKLWFPSLVYGIMRMLGWFKFVQKMVAYRMSGLAEV